MTTSSIQHTLTISVKAPERLSQAQVVELLHQLINVGQADAADSADDEELDECARGDAVDASEIEVTGISPVIS